MSVDTAIIIIRIFVLTILVFVIYTWFDDDDTMYKDDDWRTKTGR